MLAFALILALTAHSALAKPTGLCVFPCDNMEMSSYSQPSGLGQTSGGFGRMDGSDQSRRGFGQIGSSFGRMDSGFRNSYRGFMNGVQGMSGGGMQGGMGGAGMSHGNLEDFGTVNVQPSYGGRVAQMPRVVEHSQRVASQVPVQPQVEGMFQHSSGKASYESNNGFMKIYQPARTETVLSEPIIRQQMVNPCQNYYDPCL